MAIWEGVCRYVCGTCGVHVERGGGAAGRKCGVMNYMCVDVCAWVEKQRVKVTTFCHNIMGLRQKS